ncbi:hypothetical protein H4683_002642 [Filibacter limicola]|uniref:Uncharacterized protein n=1 Tax=Sporosarcina limicola TaxID=34101 RepID=A0A927MMB2_9BACL|nr:hypothetical protein [Sporosarcina limicola]
MAENKKELEKIKKYQQKISRDMLREALLQESLKDNHDLL